MRTLQTDILALLRLFGPRVLDRETHDKVLSLAEEEESWSSGHDISDMIRDRGRSPDVQKDRARQYQYYFEDMCARCLYNESSPDDPFDYDTPHGAIQRGHAVPFTLTMGDPKGSCCTFYLDDEWAAN